LSENAALRVCEEDRSGGVWGGVSFRELSSNDTNRFFSSHRSIEQFLHRVALGTQHEVIPKGARGVGNDPVNHSTEFAKRVGMSGGQGGVRGGSNINRMFTFERREVNSKK
jgi:hypothetical protein